MNTYGIDVEVAIKFWRDHGKVDVSGWGVHTSPLTIGFNRRRQHGDVGDIAEALKNGIGSDYSLNAMSTFTELEWNFGQGRAAVLYYDTEWIRLELYDYGYQIR